MARFWWQEHFLGMYKPLYSMCTHKIKMYWQKVDQLFLGLTFNVSDSKYIEVKMDFKRQHGKIEQ